MSDPTPPLVPSVTPSKRSGSETRQRSRCVVFRVSEEEGATIARAAEATGLTVGSYIRTRLLTAPTTRTTRRPPVDKTLLAQLLGQLGKVGGNIHQITKRLNFGEPVPCADLDTALAAFREASRAILEALGKRPPVSRRETADDH